MKLLTVTIPCYNSQDYMSACIESILPGGERVEIIIIDDGSKDLTGTIADSYAEKYPSIVRVVHQENGGHGEGINQGLAHATGKYFKTVDSDDTLSNDLIPFLDALEACDRQGGVIIMSTLMGKETAPFALSTLSRKTEFSHGRKPVLSVRIRF